jgi:hypothetical protein
MTNAHKKEAYNLAEIKLKNASNVKLSFNELNPDVRFNAIYTYCKCMNCFGLESQVDIFLSGKHGKKIMFNEDGSIILHEIGK